MHYYQFNIGDYRRDTFHLTLLEHGIYRQLLDTYYLNEEPLSADNAIVMRSHCVRTKEEKAAFLTVLSNFFILTEKGFIHRGCEKTIAQFREKSAKARVSAQSRWVNKNAIALRTQCEGNANRMLTINHKPIHIKNKASAYPKPDDVDQNLWDAFVQHRKSKKAPITEIAMAGIYREVEKTDMNLNDALREVIERNWQSFKAEWVNKTGKPIKQAEDQFLGIK